MNVPHTTTQREHGVTLVEILITIGLLSGFLLILVSMFISSVDVQSNSENYSAVSTEGRFILTRLSYDIRRATAVTTPASLGGSDASLSLTIAGSTYTYTVSGDTLQLTVDGVPSDLTGNGVSVSGLSFQRLGGSGGKDSVRYNFTVSGSNTGAHQPETQTFTSTTERRL